MYKLPQDFDCSFFLDKILEQVCINENQITFHFDCQIWITTETQFAYRTASGETNMCEVPSLGGDYLGILGATVTASTSDSSGTLRLSFKNGCALEFLDTSDEYESYHINFDGKTITV